MKKPSQKLFLHYILLGIVLLLVLIIAFLFKAKEKNFQQTTISQSNIPTTTILPISGSDLSYLKIVTDPDLNVKLLDIGGNEIGETFIQQPITDPVNPGNKNKSIKELNIQKPVTGNYQLIISSNADNISKISTYFYDINGEVSIAESTTTGDASFTIFFDKDNSKKSYIKK